MTTLAVFVVSLITLGCGGDSGAPWVSSGGRQTFSNLGISVVLPADWVILYDSSIPEVHVWNTHKDFSEIPIETITIEPTEGQFSMDSADAMDCDERTESGRTLVRCVSTDYSSNSDVELTTIDFYLNLYLDETDGRKYVNYRVRCQTPTDSLERYEQAFQTAAESFRLGGR